MGNNDNLISCISEFCTVCQIGYPTSMDHVMVEATSVAAAVL